MIIFIGLKASKIMPKGTWVNAKDKKNTPPSLPNCSEFKFKSAAISITTTPRDARLNWLIKYIKDNKIIIKDSFFCIIHSYLKHWKLIHLIYLFDKINLLNRIKNVKNSYKYK